ncbi:Ribosome LSU-associated GTP-binding protein HflX [hydrothermal vent metagenome]|uniref:Ribosome LSU-associated GTP-binding protein HflX n=1 Tax=hydrothermal vent metagenome TaxID=652676 RepID=A0A3B0TU94_9ZZZZ
MTIKKTRNQSIGIEFSRGPKAFFERKKAATRTMIISPDIKTNSVSLAAFEARFNEFGALARSIRLKILDHEKISVRSLKPATFFGTGQVEQLAEKFAENDVELVLIDAVLTPIQQRNLENKTGVKILDRTALILEIFGERAVTREGVLQVELAHLNYQRSRLVRSWTHLERQRGGFGFLGGPGETQIEADRRQLRTRIASLEKRIEKIRKTRAMQRKPRDSVPFPLVALVGYTNAGKSTLFNLLTGAEVSAKDQLFATLDTTVRKVDLPHKKRIILSDTVGFIADLPTDLVSAFRATLEEVVLADVILHIRDISNANHEAQANEVMGVLASLGVNADLVPIIEVWNKIDLLGEGALEDFSAKPSGTIAASAMVSSTDGRGIDDLLAKIEDILAKGNRVFEVKVSHSSGQDASWLYSYCEVLEKGEPSEDQTIYSVRVDPRHMDGFLERFADNIL